MWVPLRNQTPDHAMYSVRLPHTQPGNGIDHATPKTILIWEQVMSLRQLYLRSRSARKAATHLDYAYPPRHGTSPRACPADCRTFPCAASHDVLATLVGTFGNVAAETHKHADCHARFLLELAAITFARGRVIRLPASLRPFLSPAAARLDASSRASVQVGKSKRATGRRSASGSLT